MWGVMTKVIKNCLEVSEFELRLRSYVQLGLIFLEKGWNPLSPSWYGLNSISTVLLQGFDIKWPAKVFAIKQKKKKKKKKSPQKTRKQKYCITNIKTIFILFFYFIRLIKYEVHTISFQIFSYGHLKLS